MAQFKMMACDHRAIHKSTQEPGTRYHFIDHVVTSLIGMYSISSGFIIEHVNLSEPSRPHIDIDEDHGKILDAHHKQRPIARNWSQSRKRFTAIIACCNTVFVGLQAGIYVCIVIILLNRLADLRQAGEVPAIQYRLADLNHEVVWGNVL
ncbi:hypothetical protein MRB53_039747 [Persea americana]|nr:hypothetical protein MRB53_039747 [Persea americana]